MTFQFNMLNSLGVMARTKNVDGRTDARTHGQTDGDHYHIPPTPSGGGIIIGLNPAGKITVAIA